MDWLDNISKSNPVIDHIPHVMDEFVSSDPIERIEFSTECVNLDAPGKGSASCTVDADLIGETDIVIICSSNGDSVSRPKNC